MAIGRISGPLLAQNLLRNGVDLAFETQLLYLDVTDGRIGIQNASPQYELDVNGTINAYQFLGNSATIGLTTFFSSTGSSTISTILGPLNIIPAAMENIYLGADTYVSGNLHATGDITADGNIRLGSSTGTDTLIVDAEVSSDFLPYVGTTGTSTIMSSVSIGSTSAYWLNGYFNNVATNYLSPATGTNITMFANSTTFNANGTAVNALTINGDIRVYGGSPLGTAPVVSNVLYVTSDGNDSNDGRAEDASRACRTITGATKSPYYKQGTIIKVRSGNYYENNPIQLLPYTSVVGDDLRTTWIYPLNPTNDLFWVNSGVYIAQMTFLNLQKGSVTRYAPGGTGEYITGAYCVAFPPLLENPIDVYHSPYIQNCTNQSGPWLMDGTMFVPNNTVQIPSVWGTSTYSANTSSILFYTSSTCVSTPQLGQTINSIGFSINPSEIGPVITNISNPDIRYQQAQLLLQENRTFVQAEVVAYINTSFPSLSYDGTTCYRDVGLIMDALTYDATLGGNEQSVTAGLAYYNGNTLIIPSNEITATVAAIRYINTLCQYIITNTEPVHYYQTAVNQYVNTNLYQAGIAGPNILARTNDIINILENWTSIENAAALISSNSAYIQTETNAWINTTYPGLDYDQSLSYRDLGTILTAIQTDLLNLSNVQSIITGDGFWLDNSSVLGTNQSACAAAIQFAKTLTELVVQNQTTTTNYQNTVTQVINTGLTNGVVALSSIDTNFNTIVNIVTSGTNFAPTSTNSTLTSFVLTISTTTVSGVNSATIVYLGDTSVYPVRDPDVPVLWSTNGIADRSLDPHGSGGGALVDGNAPSSRSPIQSFVFDAFTQVTQGGNGIHIMNSGYAQLVSVFTIFCDVAVHCESGGIASITNSNSNFGDQCLLSEGFGSLEFAGTIYNPPDVSYDSNTNTFGSSSYYPAGFFPNQQQICVFIPNPNQRPHISLVMEVEPPDYYINYNGQTVPYINSAGYPGFLNAIANTCTLTAGFTTITGIDTTGIAIGHTLNVTDQYGNSSPNGVGLPYISTGTTVTGISWGTITLSNPIQTGGGQLFNDNYFNLYFSGNAYYSILSSIVGPDPVTPGQTVVPGEQPATVAAINYLNTLIDHVVSNTLYTSTYQTSVTQVIDNTVNAGTGTNSFIANDLNIISSIITQGPTATPVITTTGTVLSGASAAVKLLNENRKFLQTEILAFTTSTYSDLIFNNLKCYRDVGLIITAVENDLTTGGNFYAAQAGNTYWSKDGTYHIVTIEEDVVDPTQFVDGCVVNFYQRSYMSASGYLFEYVGAGTDYGALPQVGKADPVQTKEVIQLNNGRVFFTSTDQNGDFRIGPELVISQATGVLSGRTFQRSLFAEMTPFILAVEADTGG